MNILYEIVCGFLFVTAFLEGVNQARGASRIKSEYAIPLMFIASGIFAIAGALS